MPFVDFNKKYSDSRLILVRQSCWLICKTFHPAWHHNKKLINLKKNYYLGGDAGMKCGHASTILILKFVLGNHNQGQIIKH